MIAVINAKFPSHTRYGRTSFVFFVVVAAVACSSQVQKPVHLIFFFFTRQVFEVILEYDDDVCSMYTARIIMYI